MCGRYVSSSSPAEVAARFGVDEVHVDEHAPDWNVTPRSVVYAVRERARDDEEPRRVLSLLRWGLVPSWAKDPSVGDRMINARAESLADKPAYRRALTKRRCLIPADGFYEWKQLPGRRKQPVFVRLRDGGPLAFAGLWEIWRDPAIADDDEPGAWLRSCVIVTTEANAALAGVHDRMPVILPPSAWDEWLDPRIHDVAELSALLRPAPPAELEWWPVSTAVNRPANNGPELVEPVDVDALR